MKAIRPTKRSDGVTLLELLAVLLIAGLLAAIGIPSFNAILKGTALRNAATALTDTFSLARQLAIANRDNYYVEFITSKTDLSDSQLAAGVTADSYRIYFQQRKPPKDHITVGKWKLLPRFVVFDPDDLPPQEIVFKPTGGASAPGQVAESKFKLLHTVTGTKGKEKAMEVAVNHITGTAKAKPVLASP